MDVVVVGAGISGLATAARLRARGLDVLVLEAHGRVGGCAGFYTRAGYAFDVGATTLVDFGPEGVGGRFMQEIGLPPLAAEALPGYVAWLPDRTVALHRDPALWRAERLRAFGDTRGHRRFWALLDRLADVFWTAARSGGRLPVRSADDLRGALAAVPARDWPLARYLRWTTADALRQSGLDGDVPLRSLLGMLLQDTVHGTVDEAPLVNGALGVTIRGAGLARAEGGMRGFWTALVDHYLRLGGRLRVGTAVDRVERTPRGYTAWTRRGPFHAGQVVSTLPIWDSARIAPPEVGEALAPYLRRDGDALGGALVLCLGVPEGEVADHAFTHHQVLDDYRRPLGDGNNLFVSVSAEGDAASAPPGRRAVMVSTHCELAEWEGLTPAAYEVRRREAVERLLAVARRAYPRLGRDAEVVELGTPRTYARFTGRSRGAVGGVRQTLANTNQRAVPYGLGVPGFWQGGDTTWPGLGTVAGVVASGHLARDVARYHALRGGPSRGRGASASGAGISAQPLAS